MKILVVGAKGQLGRSLVAAAANTEDVALLAVGRPTLDLLDHDSLARAVDAEAPALVVNAAAYTAVDAAESNQDLAYAINGDAAGILAKITAERSIPLVHVSTDYVFDGHHQQAYQETDHPNPQTVYGKSKLLGEQRVAAVNHQHLIVRTSWVHSPYGHNFAKTILRLASERPELKVVADQYGNPTFAGDLATAILGITRQLSSNSTNMWGVYHVAGEGSTTWHGLAEFIVAEAAQHGRVP
jgi:dTDP-4-dehydrorhamnose reductase